MATDKITKPNDEDWFNYLNNEQKVRIWNVYVDISPNHIDLDKIYELEEDVLNAMFVSPYDFAANLGRTDCWNSAHYWWKFNRNTGFAESIERLDKFLNEEELLEWATSDEALPVLKEINDIDL